MLPAAALLAWLWMPQTPAQAPAHKTVHSASKAAAKAEPKEPAGPKPASELEKDLETALKAAPLENDQISMALSGNDITLQGTVHAAEHKGLATTTARKIAAKDGWTGFHVLNQLVVELPR